MLHLAAQSNHDRIDNARIHQIFELVSSRVSPEVHTSFFSRSFPTTIEPSTPAFSAIWRIGDCSAFLTISTPTRWSSLAGVSLSSALQREKRRTTAWDNALFNCGSGCIHRVFDTIPLFLHLYLSCTASGSQQRHQASQGVLGAFTVVVGAGLVDLCTDLVTTALNVTLFTSTINDGGLFLRDINLLGGAKHVNVTFSSLIPRSSDITWPPVKMAMSSNIALRRSPKPGALTAAILRPPRNLFTTSVANASPSTSSARIRSGRLD